MTVDFDIKEFDKYRENNCLEVKKAKGGLPLSLWETYSAFANTNGGCIILGVQENNDKSWSTTGLKDVSKLKKDFWDSIHNKQKVSISLLSDKDVIDYVVNDDVILVVKVPKARKEDRPVYIKDDMWGGTFKRDWEGDYHCTKNAVLAMLRDQTEDTPDQKVLINRKIQDLNKESIASYRRRYDGAHDNASWSKLTDEEFLVMIGAASDDTEDGSVRPTAAGLLMFGEEHRITREFPEFFLDYREMLDPNIRWTDRIQSQSGDWSGNIFDFFSRVSTKLTLDLKRPFKTDGLYRIEETPVHESVREALVNCLVNTDYFQSWSVVIEKYNDRIVFANPGSIRIGKSQMLKGGISQPRNKNLLKMFNLIGIGEHAGSGVPDIFDVWKTEKFADPVIEERSGRDGGPDRTTVTLPLVGVDHALSAEGHEKGHEKGHENLTVTKADELNARRMAIYSMIEATSDISIPQIAKRLEITDKQARSDIDYLKKSGYIRHEGPAKGGKWIVSKAYNPD